MFAKVDDCDYERIANFGRWMSFKSKHSYVWYAVLCDRRRLLMHYVITGIKGVDHIDKDGLKIRGIILGKPTRVNNARTGEYSLIILPVLRAFVGIKTDGKHR